MASLRCPICGKIFRRSETDAMPFCSERCRLVDLGRWVDERYAVPGENETDELDEDDAFSSNGNPPPEAE